MAEMTRFISILILLYWKIVDMTYLLLVDNHMKRRWRAVVVTIRNGAPTEIVEL